MYDFKKKLKNVYSNKYQYFFPTLKFIRFRQKFLENLVQHKSKGKKIDINIKSIKSIVTSKFLEKKCLKKLNKEDKKIILFFYKKYNQNLYLKKTYSKKLNKLNNQNTSLNSYVYLGNIIINLKEINDLQKLNCILKINDLSILEYSNKYNYLIKNILKNIKYENKITKIYAKKFLLNIS